MEFKAIVVITVGLLGLFSFVCGIASEITRAKPSEIAELSTRYSCEYPNTPAMELGFAAAVALLILHVIVNVATGCFCCRRTGRALTWQLRLACIFSWIAFFIGERMFLAGAAFTDGAVNSNSSSYFGYLQCFYVKPGVFASGSILAAATAALGTFYYLGASALQEQGAEANYNQGGNIPMAQPQFMPQYNAASQPQFAPQFPPQYNVETQPQYNPKGPNFGHV